MKKSFLLIVSCLVSLSSYAQTFSPSKSTIESGEEVTINAVGESNSAYFSAISVESTGMTSTPDNFGSNYVSISNVNSITFYNVPVGSIKSSFKLTLTNTHSTQDYTVTFNVRTTVSSFPGSPMPNQIKTVTVTVKHVPAPSIFHNVAKSQVFYKNDCPSGYSSDPYTYTVAANTYSSTISQADADSKAQANINANGQNAANSALTCKLVYNNVAISGNFTRNNCGSNSTPGPAVTYSVSAGQFTSLVSQADADLKAQNHLNISGQANANAIGTCIPVPYISGISIINGGQSSTFTLQNGSPGDTYLWKVSQSQASILNGQGTTQAEIHFNSHTGTTPLSMQVQVEVTNSQGVKSLVIKEVRVRGCANCPEV